MSKPTVGYGGKIYFEGKELGEIVDFPLPQQFIECPQGGCPEFYKVLQRMALLHAKKSGDYGSDNDILANLRSSEEFGVPAWVGAMIRANDKMIRIKNMAKRGRLLNESVDDSLIDLANYTVLAIVLNEEADGRKNLGAPSTGEQCSCP